ncbi:hypothetical protein HY745_00195 [Candidatus Desantisbacteria bacterium]|nr:hypothetical protein [Candidatus Desantisbacteria bacterium]
MGKFIKKIIAVLATVLLFSVVLIGCGGDKGSTSEAPAESHEESATKAPEGEAAAPAEATPAPEAPAAEAPAAEAPAAPAAGQ